MTTVAIKRRDRCGCRFILPGAAVRHGRLQQIYRRALHSGIDSCPALGRDVACILHRDGSGCGVGHSKVPRVQSGGWHLKLTYIVPLRHERHDACDELFSHLKELARRVEVIVVDGSNLEVFEQHQRTLGPAVRHVPPAFVTINGKVGSVVTGMKLASHESLVIADDDVYYSHDALVRMHDLLQTAEIVRPQNYFDPLPWHACWDTGRTLLNRTTGGDWPGTFGVRRSALQRTDGYRGDVLFENLEMVRTIKATGGREIVPLDLFVRRAPSSARHFFSQRVRQAYDELARPWRFAFYLLLLPALASICLMRRWVIVAALILTPAAVAELGRRRAGGQRVFPARASWAAPLWVLERGVCSWLALGARVFMGGVPYRRSVLRTAASSERELRRRHAAKDVSTDTLGGQCAIILEGAPVS